jgi:aminoglycoside 6'-N-acetyltransferase
MSPFPLQGPRVTLRPATEDDLPAFLRILAEPEVARWWGAYTESQARAELLEDPGVDTLAIEVEGELAGILLVGEETDPQYRHASLDITLATAHHDRGLGREALRLVVDHLSAERGHHRFTIDPAAVNERAIRCYASVGFRPVGVMRRYERAPDGTWRDGLLMDLLADELG